jgi:hypothetical protein
MFQNKAYNKERFIEYLVEVKFRVGREGNMKF